MKHRNVVHRVVAIGVLGLLSISPAILSVLAQKSYPVDYDFTDGAPGPWPKEVYYLCCFGDEPRTGVFNSYAAVLDFPFFTYPMRGSLFTGLNDTIQVPIPFTNRTDVDYSLKGKNPETWFAPCIYTASKGKGAVLWKDSTDLGYRMRGWYDIHVGWLIERQPTNEPDKIPARHDGRLVMMMDVWNLPEGTFCLCVDTTKNVPRDFHVNRTSHVYEYRAPQSLADSINSYEACFWRMVRDTNYAAAKDWIDTILTVNPPCVPGWWLRAMYYNFVHDTAEIRTSYDKALGYLDANADPAMPDSTKRLLLDAEKRYVHWVRERLEWERSLFEP